MQMKAETHLYGNFIATKVVTCRAAAILGAQADARGAPRALWGSLGACPLAAEAPEAGPCFTASCLLWLLEEAQACHCGSLLCRYEERQSPNMHRPGPALLHDRSSYVPSNPAQQLSDNAPCCSAVVRGRKPLGKDPEVDYTVMSDEEWEEEPEGESLSVGIFNLP